MKLLLLLPSFLFLSSFGSNRVIFEVLKKSEKSFPYQPSTKEFYLLPEKIDTSKLTFIAKVKIKGEDITLFDVYHRLRQESQNLGANCYSIVNKAKGDDNYYLLCNIYLGDSAILNQTKRSDPDNGKIFIISPEPLKYLNNDKVRINRTLKFVLVSGTYYTMKPEYFKDSVISIKSKNLNAKIAIDGSEVKYCTSRYFSTFSIANLPKLPVSTASNGDTRLQLNDPMIIEENPKKNIKHKDGSIESGFGKLMLQFSKPAEIK
jgi:hypothetical protein